MMSSVLEEVEIFIIGGIGDDIIASFGDIRYGELDADLVFGDNARLSI